MDDCPPALSLRLSGKELARVIHRFAVKLENFRAPALGCMKSVASLAPWALNFLNITTVLLVICLVPLNIALSPLNAWS